jgi:hypothetical protein
MRQWFRVEEPDADPAMVAGRPVRNIGPKEGLFVDEKGNSYRMAGGGQAEPHYAEVLPVEGGPRLEAGAAPMPIKQHGGQRGEKRLPVTGRRRCKEGEKPGAIANESFSEQPNRQELNLREKFAEVRRRLGYVQKHGHNERHHYSYVTKPNREYSGESPWTAERGSDTRAPELAPADALAETGKARLAPTP